MRFSRCGTRYAQTVLTSKIANFTQLLFVILAQAGIHGGADRNIKIKYMSESRSKIVKFCEDYLNVKDFTDYCVNGLQVEGAEKIDKIVVGVSFSKKLIEATIKAKAQMLIVHHGLFGKLMNQPPQIKGFVKNRLKLLLENNINLCGFHLPLDAHMTIGNNASLCELLGVGKIKPFYVGFIGDLENQMPFSQFARLVEKKLATKIYSIAAGPKTVKKIGVVSGGAASEFILAAELGADVYLCGDIKESVVEAVKESQINFINAGHYNTERLGIQNLGNLLAKKFKVKVEFIDVPCEI